MIAQNKHDERHGMSEILLTKVTHPRLRPPFVERTTLLQRLTSAVKRRLTLISAPAGFGKSELVSQWVALSPFSVGWLTLDEGDNDPSRFMRYLIATSQRLENSFGSKALNALESPQQYRLDAVMTFLLNDLTRLSDTNVLVLDDYHLITSAVVHELMAYMIDHLPVALHLVIITRIDPPLPLARLRAHDDLAEIRTADLRFTYAETETFLRQSLPDPLPETSIAQLEQITEGWIVGLRLAAMSLKEQHPAEYDRVLRTFSGEHKHIVEYLCSEVLAAQPETVREFLFQTAFLTRLTGALCNAVTQRQDGDELLQALERSNFFLIPLDDTRTWYRLHTLVAEAMRQFARQHFGEDQIRQLYRRASQWYETNGYAVEAVEAALAAEDVEHAADLIEHIIEPQLVKRNYEYHTLRRWLEQLPDEVLKVHPTLCLTLAVALLFTSDRHLPSTAVAIQKPLGMAQAAWTAENNKSKLGELLAFRSLVEYWQGEFAQVFETSKQALKFLAEEQLEWRALMLLNLGWQQYLSGENAKARQLLQESARLNKSVGNEFAKRSTIALLGNVSLSQGRLYEAEQHFRELHAASPLQPRDKAQALVGLATVAFERNELDRVQHHLTEAMAAAEKVKDNHLRVEAAILLARLKHAQGDGKAARASMQTLAARLDMAVHVRDLLAWDAWLALMSGEIAAANAWHMTYQQNEASPLLLQQEREALIAARLLLAQGNIDAALDILDQWKVHASTAERRRTELEILILQALARFTDRRLDQAQTALREALAFAHKAGYIRPFVQEGEAMAVMLKNESVGAHIELAAFSRSLLRAMERDQTVNEVSVRLELLSVIDPLSPQEQRVFLLLAEGQSNPDIADELGVSINTIKTQVKNIYSKLNIHTRRQAREMARALNLV